MVVAVCLIMRQAPPLAVGCRGVPPVGEYSRWWAWCRWLLNRKLGLVAALVTGREWLVAAPRSNRRAVLGEAQAAELVQFDQLAQASRLIGGEGVACQPWGIEQPAVAYGLGAQYQAGEQA